MDGESDEVNRATLRAGCERRSVLAEHVARALSARIDLTLK
jgi:hypothetical protein